MSLVAQRLARVLWRRGGQSVWAVAEYLAYPLLMFLATPFLLRTLGQEHYGQWLLLLTFNGFGGLAGLGMGTAVVKEVSEKRGAGDNEAAANAVRSGLTLTLLSTAVLAIGLVIIGVFAGPSLLAPMGGAGTVRVIFIGAAALITLEQIDIVFASAIRGLERFDLSARIEVLSKVVTVAVTVGAAMIFHSLGPVIVATLVATVLRGTIKAVMTARLLGSGPLLPRWEPVAIRRMFSFGIWTWAQMIGAVLLGTVDRFMIGGTLGPVALARYSVSLQLAQQVHAIPSAAAQVLLPLVSRRAKEGAPMTQTVWIALATLAGLTLAMAAPLFLFSYPILALWVGRDLAAAAAPILRIVLVGYALLGFNSAAYFALLGLGRARVVGQANLLAGLVAAILSVVLIRALGLEGAALSRLCYGVLVSPMLVILVIELRLKPTHVGDLVAVE